VLASIGGGLVYWTLTTTPSTAKLYGFQVLLGFGVGGAFQNTIIAIQAEYAHEPEMVPQATSLVTFAQLVGGIIGIAVAGTIFGNQLTTGFAKYAPNLPQDVALSVRQSVLVISTLSPEDKANVIKAYSDALGYVFILAIPSGAFASMGGLLIRNFNLKTMNLQPGMAAA